jgi:hypothetical protein
VLVSNCVCGLETSNRWPRLVLGCTVKSQCRLHDEILAVLVQNLEYATRRVQIIQVGLKLYGSNQLLEYAGAIMRSICV